MGVEHRRYERIAVELPCRLFIEGDRRGELHFEAFSKTGNLCLGGVYLMSTFLLRVGLELMVELELPSGPLPIPGRVAHAVAPGDPREETGMGIEFHDVDATARETLLRYFAPVRYHQFYSSLTHEFPKVERELAIEQVSLVLNLWEEWKVTQAGGPLGTASGAPPAIARKGR